VVWSLKASRSASPYPAEAFCDHTTLNPFPPPRICIFHPLIVFLHWFNGVVSPRPRPLMHVFPPRQFQGCPSPPLFLGPFFFLWNLPPELFLFLNQVGFLLPCDCIFLGLRGAKSPFSCWEFDPLLHSVLSMAKILPPPAVHLTSFSVSFGYSSLFPLFP